MKNVFTVPLGGTTDCICSDQFAGEGSGLAPGRLRAKFAAYNRYRASDHAARSYAGFPTLLVVTTGPAAEQRLARALRAADAGRGLSLSALLTTTGLLETTHGGPLGPV